MNRMTKSVLGLICVGSLFAGSRALADVPPPDVCQVEKAACQNAGANYDEDGVCTKATCSRGSANGQVTTYECLRCEPGTVPGAAGSTTVPKTGDHKDDGGCSVGALSSEKSIATLMLGLGLVALGISRRRR